MNDKNILNSRQVMKMLNISENTLLKYEKDGTVKIGFRLGNRKRYYGNDFLDI